MKIAYLSSFFPPDRVAGAELGTMFMARHMAGRGNEAHVIVTRPRENRRRREERDGYSVHWMDYSGVKGLRLFSEIRGACGLLRSLKPDIIHGNCLLPGGYVASRMGLELGVPSVALCYGYDVSDMGFILAAAFGKRAMRDATLLLGATGFTAGVVQGWRPGRPVGVFYAGCDDAAFPLLPLRIPEKPYRMLFIGRLIPEKGVDLLPEIMRELPEEYTLEILGDGNLREELSRRFAGAGLEKRISFSGVLPNDQLSRRFAASDCLLLPSRREPFGVVCIEAVSSGVPVVCSGVMGLPEAMSGGRGGILVRSEDAKVWAGEIRRAVEDRELRRRMYAEAAEDRGKWAWSARLSKLEKMYDDLIHGRPAL